MAATTALKAIDRDRLMKDLITETAEEDIEKLMNACADSLPNNVHFIDWVVMVSEGIRDGDWPIDPSIMASASAEIKARDRLMRDVIAETAEGDRGRLLYVSLNTAPDNVAFIDWVVIVSIASQIRILDLHNDNAFNFCVDSYDSHVGLGFCLDADGRIISLSFGYMDPPFDIPASTCHLERLTDLTVANCRSLPVELSKLPNLQALYLSHCSRHLNNFFPAQMNLSNLQVLYVSGDGVHFQPSPIFLVWLARKRNLPKLEKLEFRNIEEDETGCILKALSILEFSFQETLRQIDVSKANLDEIHLENLLLKVLPRFPNMGSIHLVANKIKSVQSIVNRVKNDNSCVVSKSLRVLNFYENPIMEKGIQDPKEKAAFLGFLQIFNSIFNLGGPSAYGNDSEVEYALIKNHAGRSIVEGLGDDQRPIPLSVWSTALARASVEEIPTGLYYLLRDGPVLVGRPDLATKTASCDNDDNNNNNNDDGDNGDEKNEIPSKRKLVEIESAEEITVVLSFTTVKRSWRE